MNDKIIIEVDKESLKKFKDLCKDHSRSVQTTVEEYIDHIIDQNPVIFIREDEEEGERSEFSVKIDSQKVEKLREYCKQKNISVQMLIGNFIKSQVSSMDIA